MEIILIHKLLIVLISAIGVWLAFLVYSSSPKEKINRLFVLMTIFMLTWINFACISRFIDQPDMSLILSRIAWLTTPLLFASLYFLTIWLIQEEKKYQLLSKIVLFLGTIFALVTGFTALILEGINFDNGVLSFIYGKGILSFLIVIFFMVCATLYPLFKKYFRFSEKEREKIRFFLIGIFIFYLANIIFNIFLPMVTGISKYYYLGDYSLIFLLGFTAYAIVKHKLFGTKVVLTTLFVSLMAILLALDVFAFTAEPFFQLFKGGILLVFLYFGYLLIKSVLEETKQREKLEGITNQLKELNEKLEQKVQERTKKIQEQLNELNKWYKGTIGRELKMVELKKEIEELKKKSKGKEE